MPSTKERGVLLLLDEAFIERLDRETVIVGALTHAKVPRTQLMREMLRVELDRRSLERGETVPTAEPVSFSFAAVEPLNVEREIKQSEAKGEVDEGSPAVCGGEPADRGDVEDRAVEGKGEDGAQTLTAETGPPPERVVPGRIAGSVRKVGVRSGKA